MKLAANLEILATEVSDIDIIRPLWEQLNGLNRSLHKRCFGDVIHQTWADFLCDFKRRSDQCDLKLNIARMDQALVGYCISSINRRFEGEIVSLFVLPEFRGHGVGTDLMREHLTWLRELRVKSVFLYVHPCNTAAIRFYWRFHFFSSSPLMEVCPFESDSNE
jgi:ribosomal protein S18 acetylase RimI-like enzyme